MQASQQDLFVDINFHEVFDFDENKEELITPVASTLPVFNNQYTNSHANLGHNFFQSNSNFTFASTATPINHVQPFPPSVFFHDEFQTSHPLTITNHSNSNNNNNIINNTKNNDQHDDMNNWFTLYNTITTSPHLLPHATSTSTIEARDCIADMKKKSTKPLPTTTTTITPSPYEKEKKSKRQRIRECSTPLSASDVADIDGQFIIKGPWKENEDELLFKLVTEEMKTKQPIRWTLIAKKVKSRTPKQCRERWTLNLNPSINHNPFTPAEDAILINAYNNLGPRWTKIKELLDGRTENAVKTRHKSLMRKMTKKGKSHVSLNRQTSLSSDSSTDASKDDEYIV